MVTESIGMTRSYSHTIPRSVGVAREREAARVHSNVAFKDIALALFIIFIPVVSIYILGGINAQEEYSLQGMRAQVMDLYQQNETEKLEVSKLEAPQRIQAIAEKDLGMQVPDTAVFGSDTLNSEAQ